VTETGSGIASYDVDVSDGGAVFPWRSNITQTSAVYTGQRGIVYAFRVTVVDRANNAGSAEATALAETVRKYYALAVASGAAGRRVAMRENGVVYYLHGDHLGSTSLVTCGSAGGCKGTPYQGMVAEQLYMPYGAPRWTSGTLPTDYRFTGQRADSYIKLYQMGARWYDGDLGRWISPDTIVPQPGNPQSLNRYSYVLGNPLKYVDPTGHWTEEQLAQGLGKDWREKYFGKNAAFEGRDKLLEFLLSDKTSDMNELDLVKQLMEPGRLLASSGISLQGFDAIGGRIAYSANGAAYGAGSLDIVLNMTSGELGIFGSPEGGVVLGVGANLVGGYSLIANLPNNQAYRGAFSAVGGWGAHYAGINIERFWSAPLPDTFNVADVPNGAFVGGGPGEGGGVYYSMSFSFEVLRVDKSGSHWFPDWKNYDLLSPVRVVAHDMLLAPIWPWSPYRSTCTNPVCNWAGGAR
jgi:RHS repeat-associated protein